MPFTFEIAKPKNIKKALLSTKKKLTDISGTFSGDENSGRFSGRGVEGLYAVGESSVKITITKKPALYPVPAVKSVIEDFFRE